MPIKIQNDLPARAALESENIFVMDETRAMTQDIRPLQILILNIMPVKDDYETQLLRALSNTPLQVEVTFLNVSTHESTHTSVNHLNKFYHHFGEVKNRHFDGMIITGAPVEHLSFEEVEYWEELCSIMEWTKTHVTSTFHICWGAFAGMYYHYGIPKVDTKEKLSGVYLHRVLDRKTPLVRGFDDVFYAPESRYTGVRTEDVEAVEELTILADSERGGVFLAQDEGARKIFLFGHPDQLVSHHAFVEQRPLIGFLAHEPDVGSLFLADHRGNQTGSILPREHERFCLPARGFTDTYLAVIIAQIYSN